MSLLSDLGGMEQAIGFVFAPMVAGVAIRAFNYDLVTRHMKVKKRTNVITKMPEQKITSELSK